MTLELRSSSNSYVPTVWVLRPFGNHRFGRLYSYADVVDPVVIGDNLSLEICPKCKNRLGALPWLPPHRIKLSGGRHPDFLWGAGFDLMLSQRAIDLFAAKNVVGITRIDPVAQIVPSKRFKAPPSYRNIWYTHRGASLDDEASGVRRPSSVTCDYCRQGVDAIQRIVLTPGSWNGADIFVAYGLPGSILITEKVKSIIEKEKLTGASIYPAEEYYFDFATGDRKR